MNLAQIINLFYKIDFNGLILPLLIYAITIAVYGIFIWAMYKSLSKRDIFKLEIDQKKRWKSVAGYIVKYLILFPIFVFIWFSFLTIILAFLSKSQSVEEILLISMSIIAAVRITSYYKEEIAIEIAKILPIAVLGIFIVDPHFITLGIVIERLSQLPGMVVLLFNYFLITIILEFLLRFVLGLKMYFSKKKANR
jgi:nicotinamide riboside transporter PnuC